MNLRFVFYEELPAMITHSAVQSSTWTLFTAANLGSVRDMKVFGKNYAKQECNTPPSWTEGMTHACENITFPQLLLRVVIIG